MALEAIQNPSILIINPQTSSIHFKMLADIVKDHDIENKTSWRKLTTFLCAFEM